MYAAYTRVYAASTRITHEIMCMNGAFMRVKTENTGIISFFTKHNSAVQVPEVLKGRTTEPSGTLVGRDFGRVLNRQRAFFANGAKGTMFIPLASGSPTDAPRPETTRSTRGRTDQRKRIMMNLWWSKLFSPHGCTCHKSEAYGHPDVPKIRSYGGSFGVEAAGSRGGDPA